jgi:hypothetical protein
MRRKWVWKNGEMIEVTRDYQEAPRDVHYIQTDELPEAVESYATDEGLKFTSKSALRRHYKEHGYEDTGGSHLSKGSPKPYKSNYEEIRNSVAESLNKLKWGMAPLTEKERELCQKEQPTSNEILRKMNYRWE